MTAASERRGEQHREFVPIIAAIETLEEHVGGTRIAPVKVSTASLHETLAHGLIPHAIGEGRTVFPVLRKITGSSKAATEMNRQHQQIARLTDELESVREDLVRSGLGASEGRRLSEVLVDLRDTVREHFEAEEEACFEVLRAELSREDARSVFEAMDQAAAEVRGLYE